MNNSGHWSIRTIQDRDLPFLWDMLYEAAAVSDDMRALGKQQALSLVENQKYLAGWGRTGDAGVIALDSAGRQLGAAWYRLFSTEAPGYGFVSSSIPELTISVHEVARAQGVGHALLQELLSLAKQQGYVALSLSVDRQNPARRLYERLGFRDAGISRLTDTSVTLVCFFSEDL